ncbi:MAG: DUF4012 domain-containing protein [Nocardioidaceae bacterium]|nr:DUF4012 domain-containing protein [Nocardioidaceae bacterium]
MAVRAVKLLPPMLGPDGPRSYLVMFQNTAELRAAGGIPGAIAIIRAAGGKLRLTQQGDAGSLGSYRWPVLPLAVNGKKGYSP